MPSRVMSLRSLWTRVLLRGVHYRNRHRQINALYWIDDPWDLKSSREQYRFDATNQVILREFGHVGSVLEIGCGEGYQSAWLAQICDHLHSCDISARAVARARQRCPQVRFSVGTVDTIAADTVAGYDLVVACEVLYYMSNVPETIKIMSRLGNACLVSYHNSQDAILDQVSFPPEGGGRSRISHGEDVWSVVWWRPERGKTGGH